MAKCVLFVSLLVSARSNQVDWFAVHSGQITAVILVEWFAVHPGPKCRVDSALLLVESPYVSLIGQYIPSSCPVLYSHGNLFPPCTFEDPGKSEVRPLCHWISTPPGNFCEDLSTKEQWPTTHQLPVKPVYQGHQLPVKPVYQGHHYRLNQYIRDINYRLNQYIRDIITG